RLRTEVAARRAAGPFASRRPGRAGRLCRGRDATRGLNGASYPVCGRRFYLKLQTAMRSAAVLLSSARKTGRRNKRRSAAFRRRVVRGGLKLRRTDHGLAPLRWNRSTGIEARLVTPRYRPRIAPPSPAGFAAAVI